MTAGGLAYGVLWVDDAYDGLTSDVGDQRSPEQIFLGTEARPSVPSKFVVPIEAVAGVVFAPIALTFVGSDRRCT